MARHRPDPVPRNKARMKDELRRHGLPCARHRLLIVEARLPELGAPSCDHYDGDVSIAVRPPDTEVVLAAMRTITETIAISTADETGQRKDLR
jgi:hypothetical protein